MCWWTRPVQTKHRLVYSGDPWLGQMSRVSHSRVGQTAAKLVVCRDWPGYRCSVHCYHEKLSTPTFLSMSQMRKKKRPRKFQKQPNTILTMCLERGIHTPHTKRVPPETRCTNWFRFRTVAGQTTKQRDANTSATTRLLVGEGCDQHALCNTTINLGCWMLLIVIFDHFLVTLDATSLTVLDFAYLCPSRDVHLHVDSFLDLYGSCHLHVNLVLSSPFQFL